MQIKLDPGAYMPTKAHRQDAGWDLYSRETKVVKARESEVFDTGVHILIPDGYAGVMISKSGLNVNKSMTSTGLLDAGYVGSIKVKLYNHGKKDYIVFAGNKISQIMFVPIVDNVSFTQVDEFEQTERGENGFGSSGV